MHANARNGNLVAQRCLLGTLHLTHLRRLASRASHPKPYEGPHFSLQVSSCLRSGRRPQGFKKSLLRLKLRPLAGPSPTHVFLPTVTLFCRIYAANDMSRTGLLFRRRPRRRETTLLGAQGRSDLSKQSCYISIS